MNEQYSGNLFPILDEGTVKELHEKVRNIGKPSIFIGSSQEALSVAEKVKSSFPKEQFQVDIWSDGIFGTTKSHGGSMSNMEWLKNFTDIYDIAIFIFVPDDQVLSLTRFDMEKGDARNAFAVRHNVVFEFGMFLGRIGVKRSFILFDKKVEGFINLFFTDLKEDIDSGKTVIEVNTDFRIELYSYEGNYAEYIKNKKEVLPYDEISLNKALAAIAKRIIQNFASIEINFLPATTLAFGYFNNFIAIFASNLNLLKTDTPYPTQWIDDQGISIDTLNGLRAIVQQSQNIKLKIVIPTSIEGSRQESFTPDFDKKAFLHINFPGKNRSITVLTKRELKQQPGDNQKEFIIYDVPTTLNSSIEAIEMVTKHGDIRELLKEKEIRNFKKALEHKLNTSAISITGILKEHVELITYDQFKEETK